MRLTPLFFIPSLAFGQIQCGPSDEVEKYLKKEYNEAAVFEADRGNGDIFQLFVSPDMKTGTVIFKKPSIGLSCFMDSFENARPAGKSQIPQVSPHKNRGKEFII